MLNKLKRKFVWINMGLVSVVLLLFFSLNCFNTYHQEQEDVDRALDMAITDTFSDKPAVDQIGRPLQEGTRRTPEPDGGRNEKPFSYAAVVVLAAETESGQEILRIDNRNASMEDATRKEAVSMALERDEPKGRLSELGLFYMKQESAEGTKIAFVDTAHFDALMEQVVITALVLFLLAVAALFFVSVLLAKIAVAPVKKAWDQQSRFVADASHELKTPLTVILANHEIILSSMEGEGSKEKKWLESAQAEAIHMKALIDDLLFLARSDEEAEGRQLVKSKVSLSELVMEVSLQFEPVMFEAGVSFDTDIADEVFMECDVTQIRQLLHILMDNAVKYTGKHGHVFASLQRISGNIRLSVANTGEPVKEEELDSLFERFYRSDQARTREGGYGLGLCIAKSIVQNHAGTIKASSGVLRYLEDFKALPGQFHLEQKDATGTLFTVIF